VELSIGGSPLDGDMNGVGGPPLDGDGGRGASTAPTSFPADLVDKAEELVESWLDLGRYRRAIYTTTCSMLARSAAVCNTTFSSPPSMPLGGRRRCQGKGGWALVCLMRTEEREKLEKVERWDLDLTDAKERLGSVSTTGGSMLFCIKINLLMNHLY
jgi:hypothetical protein